MSLSNDFLDYILDQLSNWGDVSETRMFDGAGRYRGGSIFGPVADGLASLEVDDTGRNKFTLRGALPLKPFPKRPALLSILEVPEDIQYPPEELIEWVKKSFSLQKKPN